MKNVTEKLLFKPLPSWGLNSLLQHCNNHCKRYHYSQPVPTLSVTTGIKYRPLHMVEPSPSRWHEPAERAKPDSERALCQVFYWISIWMNQVEPGSNNWTVTTLYTRYPVDPVHTAGPTLLQCRFIYQSYCYDAVTINPVIGTMLATSWNVNGQQPRTHTLLQCENHVGW